MGGGESIERRKVGGGLACALIEVGRQVGEINAVHFAVVIKIALIPTGHGLIKIARKDCEIGAVYFSVEVGVAEKCVFDFDRTRGKTSRVIRVSRIGKADTVKWIGLGGCRIDAQAVPTSTGIAAEKVTADGRDRIGATGVVDKQVIVFQIEGTRAGNGKRRNGNAADVTGQLHFSG